MIQMHIQRVWQATYNGCHLPHTHTHTHIQWRIQWGAHLVDPLPLFHTNRVFLLLSKSRHVYVLNISDLVSFLLHVSPHILFIYEPFRSKGVLLWYKKVCSYIAQYPARWTTKIALNFSSPGRHVHSNTNCKAL